MYKDCGISTIEISMNNAMDCSIDSEHCTQVTSVLVNVKLIGSLICMSRHSIRNSAYIDSAYNASSIRHNCNDRNPIVSLDLEAMP